MYTPKKETEPHAVYCDNKIVISRQGPLLHPLPTSSEGSIYRQSLSQFSDNLRKYVYWQFAQSSRWNDYGISWSCTFQIELGRFEFQSCTHSTTQWRNYSLFPMCFEMFSLFPLIYQRYHDYWVCEGIFVILHYVMLPRRYFTAEIERWLVSSLQYCLRRLPRWLIT